MRLPAAAPVVTAYHVAMIDRAALRKIVEAEVVAAFAQYGEKMSSAVIVKAHLDRGATRATLFRWVKKKLEAVSGRKVIPGAGQRQSRSQNSSNGGKTGVAVKEPEEISGERLSAAVADGRRRHGTSEKPSVLDELDCSIYAAHQIMIHARNADGTVKNTKLLSQGAELLRRCMETKQRMLERVFEIGRIEAFQREMIEEVRRESEDCASRILERWVTVTTGWGAV